jgi:TolB-like protein/tetratricopeptide (TPR) repeat protein
MSLIAELQRRKVFKVGGAYLVVAWLAVQAVSIGFPAFDAPPWLLRVFILVAMLGFPAALVLAWAFDATPDGVKADVRGRAGVGVYIAAAAIAGLAIGWYFKGQPSYRAGEEGTYVARDAKSIAVLPFVNMSGKPDQEYFSDGMTEELLNVLAKVPQLKVVARTSVFAFKDKGGDVREIGRKLGIAYIVEGSVRRDADEVRITAQLVRVADGFHVWSDTYDRKLEGVFALQDDIARHIGEALKQSLGVVAPVAARAAVDPAAYDEYLKGRALLRQRSDLPGAIAHFAAAVAKAPDFAAGWSSLSLAREVSFWYVLMDAAQANAVLAEAATAAARAAALDPESAATEHALGNVARAQFHYAEAERHYLRAMQIDPGYPDAREDYAELLWEVGRGGESLEAARQLERLDPYFVAGLNRVLQDSLTLGSRDEVQQAVQQLLAVAPDSFFALTGMLDYALLHGDAAAARAELAQIEQQRPAIAETLRVLLPWALGEAGVDEARLATAIDHAPAGSAAQFIVARGDLSAFNDYTGRKGPIAQGYYFIDLYRVGSGRRMLRDPRAKARLQEYGFVAYWRETGWPAGCRPLGDADFECTSEAAAAP